MITIKYIYCALRLFMRLISPKYEILESVYRDGFIEFLKSDIGNRLLIKSICLLYNESKKNHICREAYDMLNINDIGFATFSNNYQIDEENEKTSIILKKKGNY